MVHFHGARHLPGAEDIRPVALRWKAADIESGEPVDAPVGCGELCGGNLGVQGGVEGASKVLLGSGVGALPGGVCDALSEAAIERGAAKGAAPGLLYVHSCTVGSEHSLGSHIWGV